MKSTILTSSHRSGGNVIPHDHNENFNIMKKSKRHFTPSSPYHHHPDDKINVMAKDGDRSLKCINTFDTDDCSSSPIDNNASFLTEINTSIISEPNTSLVDDVKNMLYDSSSRHHHPPSHRRRDNSNNAVAGPYQGPESIPADDISSSSQNPQDSNSIINTQVDMSNATLPEKDLRTSIDNPHGGDESSTATSKKRGHRRSNNFYSIRRQKSTSDRNSTSRRSISAVDEENIINGSDSRNVIEDTPSFCLDGLTHDEQHQYNQASQGYERTLHRLRESGYDDNHPDVADTIRRMSALRSIAEALITANGIHSSAHDDEMRGDHEEARQKYCQALDIKMQALRDVPHPSVALTLHKIGVVMWKSGVYDKSLEYLAKALDLYKKCTNNIDFDIAETFHSTGHVYLSMGQFDSATTYFKESLKLKTATYNQNHPEVARTLISLGMVFDERGKHTKAMKYYREGLHIQRTHYGNNHVDVAATLNGIGVAHEKWGEYNQAMESYSEALWIYRSALGNDHVDVAVTLNNTGQIYRYWGEYDEAMRAYQEALRIMKNVLGQNHRNVAATVHNIALVYANTHDYDKATKLFRDVLKAQRAALGDEHVDVAVTLDSFGDVYERKGKYDKALKLYTKALRVRRSALGKNHIFVAITLDRLAEFHNDKMHDREEALRRFTEALEIYQVNNMKVDHPCIEAVVKRIDDMRNSLLSYNNKAVTSY